MNRKLPFLAVIALLALVGCNKDDVIPEPDPEPDPIEEDDGSRPITALSSPFMDTVYEYTPAPGQFINETVSGGFTGEETTAEAAAAFAMSRLTEQKFVSLGSFGGYIVVGFDHSIFNNDGYDLAILGNAFNSASGGSNEPGVVWVMKDSNGNGEPDDVWYELKGSETGAAGTRQNFSVTYYRPAEVQQAVSWLDADGNTGTVDYLKAYHKQDYYYPAWITEDSYTLSGTCLEARNYQDPTTGLWSNPSYDWGYVDNIGSDALYDEQVWNGFDVSNAIDANGNDVALEYIDFVKVQCALLAKSGWLGEISTEVFSFADQSMSYQ